MAHVYLATDRKLDRPVALKVLKPELASLLGADRFTREIEITSHLQHPHILPLLDAGTADGLPFYVMPYVEGESLADRLRREHQIPIEDAVRIASEVADALAYAHGHGVVHRDIKPDNIMLAGDDVLVADFGIARALDVSSGDGITSSGVALGTPSYMSPEQASGTGEVDPRTDVYGLACVLYEMLVGEPPFTGPTARAIFARQASEPVPRISIVRDTVPTALERVIAKGLAKVPADRYATALEFKNALAHVSLAEEAPPTTIPLRRILAGLGLTAVVAAAGWLVWKAFHPPTTGLDDEEIIVYPFISPANPGSERLGEDVATIIGHRLNGTGPLRWIDGWGLLADDARNDARQLSLHDARAIARQQRSGRFVTGRVILQGDSAVVYLDLHDARSDSTLRGVSAASHAAMPWEAGLRAVAALLPAIIPSGSPDLGAIQVREPRAVASFLLGERAFRRGAFDSALAQYREALAGDSMFALAAIRGAQAAGWIHDSPVARSMIRRAVELSDRLTPRDAALARGFAAFLDGRADTAFAEFHTAVELDPEMAMAWWMLGDAYSHLLPARGPPDSLAEAALVEALRLDSTAVHPLFHLIEISIRKGERERTERLWERFTALRPDSALYHRIRIMRACVHDGVEGVNWDEEAPRHAMDLLSAGRSLAAAGSQIVCAEAAFAAVLRGDTASDADGVGRRWAALFGLQSLLLASSRADEVAHLLDSAAAGMAGAKALFLLDAAVTGLLVDRAAEVAREDAARYGPEYRGSPSPTRLWIFAVWEASRGRAPVVAAIADELDRRADASGARLDRLLADAAAVHATLARGDSTGALEMLLALRTTAPREALTWHTAEPLGYERLLLAELLLARGRAREALEVAQVFDSQEPLIYALYLARSLEVRVRAAEAAGSGDLARRLSGRLERVQSYRRE